MSREDEKNYYREVARGMERIADFLDMNGEKNLSQQAITAAIEIKTLYAKYDSMRQRVNELMGNANVD